MTTALYEMKRRNLRHDRAMALAAALMHEIEDVVDQDFPRRAVFERLLDVLTRNGMSWLTDEDRDALDLEPRDELGWTPSETVAAERARIDAMQMMSAAQFIPAENLPASIRDLAKKL